MLRQYPGTVVIVLSILIFIMRRSGMRVKYRTIFAVNWRNEEGEGFRLTVAEGDSALGQIVRG